MLFTYTSQSFHILSTLFQHRSNLLNFIGEVVVGSQHIFYFIAGVHNSGVIPSPKFFPYRWVRNIIIFSQYIHNYLSWLHILLFTVLLIYIFFCQTVEITDYFNYILYRSIFLGFGGVFYKAFDICNVQVSPLQLCKFQHYQRFQGKIP